MASTKFQIIAEYETVSPFVGCTMFETFEAACDAVAEDETFKRGCAKRIWIVARDDCFGTWIASATQDVCVYADGKFCGPLGLEI